MKPRVLILVTSDPKTSARPAEAVRIAAGLSASRETDTALYLGNAALLALSETCDELVDGDCFERYLPMVAESGALYLQRNSTFATDIDIDPTRWKARTLDEEGLASLAADSTYLLRF